MVCVCGGGHDVVCEPSHNGVHDYRCIGIDIGRDACGVMVVCVCACVCVCVCVSLCVCVGGMLW